MAIDCLRSGVLGLELHTSAAWCTEAAAVLVPEEDGVGLLLAMSLPPGVDPGTLSKQPPPPTLSPPPIIVGVLAFEVAFVRRGALIAEPRKEEEEEEAEAEKELILVVLVEAVVVL